jgi:hypothetical protein
VKGRQLAIILGLLVVLGGIALFLSRRNEADWSKTATRTDTKLLEFDLNEVSQVTIKRAGAEVNLLKKEDVWTLRDRDYPADFERVSTLIRTLWEMRPVQDVKVGASQLGVLQLSGPSNEPHSSALVELQGAGDKKLASLLVGKKYLRGSNQSFAESGIPAGRYVKDSHDRVFIVSQTLDDVELKPERWLASDFIKISDPKSITTSGGDPAKSWTLVRDNPSGPWRFADPKPGEELDAAKATAATNAFAAAPFIDVLAPNAPSTETGLDNPTTARFETFDGFTYELRIGKVMGESQPVLVRVEANLPKERTAPPDEKPEDKTRLDQEFATKQKQLTEKLATEQKLQGRPYLIGKGTIERLLVDRSTLIKQPSPAPSAAPAAPAPAGPKASVVTSPVAAPPGAKAPAASPKPAPSPPAASKKPR